MRSGETQAIVAAEFELPADHPVFTMLAEQGIEPERGEPLLVRRTLRPTAVAGRSRAGQASRRHCCGATSPIASSKSMASMTTVACCTGAATVHCSTCLAGSTRHRSQRHGRRSSAFPAN